MWHSLNRILWMGETYQYLAKGPQNVTRMVVTNHQSVTTTALTAQFGVDG